MPYNEGFYAEKTKALTKSMYARDYVEGIHPSPPQAFFLVDANENYITDGTDGFIVGVVT